MRRRTFVVVFLLLGYRQVGQQQCEQRGDGKRAKHDISFCSIREDVRFEKIRAQTSKSMTRCNPQ
jgi:hypothetical protein